MEKVLVVLARHHINAVVIGAVALAAHHYVRQTENLDLGVNADVPTLRAVVRSLHEAGLEAKLREPDGEDIRFGADGMALFHGFLGTGIFTSAKVR